MKKLVVLMCFVLLFTGCGAEDVFETVADDMVLSVAAPMGQISVELPEEAAAPASESEAGTLYQCDGYEIILQTMESGDLDATIREVSGYSRENVTVMQTELANWKHYEFVWASTGEQGDRLGRAVILDDGNYHYVLSVLGDADRAAEYEETWKEMFDSFTLS